MKTKVEGTYVWAVEVSGGQESNLWITTAEPDAGVAVRKTQAWLKRAGRGNETIKKLESRGTLDA